MLSLLSNNLVWPTLVPVVVGVIVVSMAHDARSFMTFPQATALVLAALVLVDVIQFRGRYSFMETTRNPPSTTIAVALVHVLLLLLVLYLLMRAFPAVPF